MGSILDLDFVEKRAKANIKENDMSERAEFVRGDFSNLMILQQIFSFYPESYMIGRMKM